jgi:hypothetical protein
VHKEQHARSKSGLVSTFWIKFRDSFKIIIGIIVSSHSEVYIYIYIYILSVRLTLYRMSTNWNVSALVE